jgi:hypothetical protein
MYVGTGFEANGDKSQQVCSHASITRPKHKIIIQIEWNAENVGGFT